MSKLFFNSIAKSLHFMSWCLQFMYDYAGRSILVQLNYSLKKYVDGIDGILIFIDEITKPEITLLAEASLIDMHDMFIYDKK